MQIHFLFVLIAAIAVVPDPAYAEVLDKASGLVLEALARFTTRKEIGVFFTLPENREF